MSPEVRVQLIPPRQGQGNPKWCWERVLLRNCLSCEMNEQQVQGLSGGLLGLGGAGGKASKRLELEKLIGGSSCTMRDLEQNMALGYVWLPCGSRHWVLALLCQRRAAFLCHARLAEEQRDGLDLHGTKKLFFTSLCMGVSVLQWSWEQYSAEPKDVAEFAFDRILKLDRQNK